ncbi:hypothetical protein, partial [Thalassospira xianhensis]|uniref:hypothetical protein n=1 Tax=Thalassospira xianhensis TaxID=478503 RepID=UPI0011BFC3A2
MLLLDAAACAASPAPRDACEAMVDSEFPVAAATELITAAALVRDAAAAVAAIVPALNDEPDWAAATA